MPYIVGILLSLVVALFARGVGFDRDRAFYPTVLIVVAAYYVLFAAMTGSLHTVFMESIVMTGFVIAAVVGFRSTAWIVVAGLAGHGVLDAFHGSMLENPGVPVWWRAFVSPTTSARQWALPGSYDTHRRPSIKPSVRVTRVARIPSIPIPQRRRA
jgi:hypothetical protein